MHYFKGTLLHYFGYQSKYNVYSMENPARYTNYKDFFPFYLREHKKKHKDAALFWHDWLPSSIPTQNYLFSQVMVQRGLDISL